MFPLDEYPVRQLCKHPPAARLRLRSRWLHPPPVHSSLRAGTLRPRSRNIRPPSRNVTAQGWNTPAPEPEHSNSEVGGLRLPRRNLTTPSRNATTPRWNLPAPEPEHALKIRCWSRWRHQFWSVRLQFWWLSAGRFRQPRARTALATGCTLRASTYQAPSPFLRA